MLPAELKSPGLIGVLAPKVTSRRPLRQTVCRSDVPGSGPMSRSSTIGAAASGTVAAISVRRSSGRFTNWLASAPSVKVSLNSARCSSVEAIGCRCSVSSTGGMMCLTQITAPTATARNATDIARPRAKLERSVESTVPTSSPTYAAMNPMLARNDRMNSTTTRRSAFFARRRFGGSSGSSRTAGSGPSPAAPSPARWPSIVRAAAGGGVPMTRCGATGTSAVSSGSPDVSSAALWSLISGLPVFCGYPHGGEHHEEQQAEERDQALGHRPDPAQTEAARVGQDAGRGHVRDDVALLARRDRGVVEDRHGLRAGQHGLVDLGRCGLGQRGRKLAVGQRAPGAVEVVALGAVGGEQLLAEPDVGAGGAYLGRGGDRRAAGQGRDVRGDVAGLGRVQLGRLVAVLGADLLGRHPAGAHLEVNGRRADPDQARCDPGDALRLEAVAGGARQLEDPLAPEDLRPRRAWRRGRG